MNRKHEDSIENSIEELNHLAMTHLTSEMYGHAMSYLNQALSKINLISNSNKKNSLLALTYYNFGCFYKRLGQADQSLNYFFQSLKLESPTSNNKETYLNISILFALKTEHELSLKYAIKALNLFKSEYKTNRQVIVSIINCYLRIGIEYKALKMLPEALQFMKKGYELCIRARLKTCEKMKKSLKSLYMDTYSEMQNKKTENALLKVQSKNNDKLRGASFSPKSTLDSHTTVWTQNSTNKSMTPRYSEKSGTSHNRRISYLPPVDEFKISRRSYLGSIDEIQEKKKKKINSMKHREQERMAAITIQAFWRGFQQRKKYYQMLIKRKIIEAEDKARLAAEEVNNLKSMARNPKMILRIVRKK
ncbi:hypothetical protein SteCoe_34459 [Stentor coeruleus]|uniref:Uncharacterized protein n=1 Tax=Stentor coeruleus TaxID=5963 RepID=A0A1R2AUH2_9CILI|nr:hypothetical protein SteCoe_34459 [Stentor coeruleus]